MNAKKTDSIMATVAARVYRAAALCHAGVDDYRTYLHGVCLHTSGDLVSTNGHILYCAKYEGEPLEGNMVFIPAKIPTQAWTVELSLVFIDNVSYVLATSKNKAGAIIHRVLCEFISGAGEQYPDHKKLFKGKYTKKKPFNRFSFDPKYLALVGKVFKPLRAGMYPVWYMYNGETGFLSIPNDEEIGKLIMMTIKIEAEISDPDGSVH
jgi:hypothetical protein